MQQHLFFFNFMIMSLFQKSKLPAPGARGCRRRSRVRHCARLLETCNVMIKSLQCSSIVKALEALGPAVGGGRACGSVVVLRMRRDRARALVTRRSALARARPHYFIALIIWKRIPRELGMAGCFSQTN